MTIDSILIPLAGTGIVVALFGATLVASQRTLRSEPVLAAPDLQSGPSARAADGAAATLPPMAAVLGQLVDGTASAVLQAAKEMPESDYGFRPAPGMRTFGEGVAHIADANRAFCTALMGQHEPVGTHVERTVHGKVGIVGALEASLTQCRSALAGLDDAGLARPATFGGGVLIDGTEIPVSDLPSGAVVGFLISHLEREYGKLTTYLRLKGLVPPTSQRR